LYDAVERDEKFVQNFGRKIRKGKRPFGKLRRRWEHYIRMDLEKWDEKVWTGCNWLKTGTSGWLL
jgi:hypothetical protein